MNVLVVEDSVVFRMSISEVLGNIAGISVCGTASNGQIALDYFKNNQHPDLVILDMEMPVMNGLETIKAIREINKKVIIIVFSSVTTIGAEKTLEALRLGANDFVTKQEASSAKSLAGSIKMIESILIPKISAFSNFINKPSITKNNNPVSGSNNSGHTGLDACFDDITLSPELILVASSTGGPEALSNLFKGITHTPKVPMLIVQHMPPVFTKSLADMLNKQTEFIEVKEAENYEKVLPGVCYIAPGDFHMALTENMTIMLTQSEKVSFVRPSATVLFESVAKNFTKKTLTFVLTGMGDDGAAGLEGLISRGDYAFIQDNKTSVVWGMPGAVHAKYPEIKELPISDVSKLINKVIVKRNLMK